MGDYFILNGEKLDLKDVQSKLKEINKTGEEFQLLSLVGDLLNSDISSVEFQSSGSTGKAKKWKFTKEQLRLSAQRTLKHFQLEPGHNLLLALPIRYVAGSMMVARALVGNCNLLTINPEMKPDLSSIQQPINFAAFTPSQVQFLIKDQSNDFEKIDKVIIGGGAISQKLRSDLTQFSNAIFETYGMTETLTHVAVRPIQPPSDVFTALPGVQFSISDEETLIINVDDLNIHDLQTTDLIKLFDSSTFHWLGRKDFIINSGGVKVNPEQMEVQIQSIVPSPFLISCVNHKLLGQELVLVLEKNENLNEDELIDQLKKTLYPGIYPKHIRQFDQIPTLPTGKVNRKKVLDLLAS